MTAYPEANKTRGDNRGRVKERVVWRRSQRVKKRAGYWEGLEGRIRQENRERTREGGIEASGEAVGGKEERGKRQERGVNIKARFKGHEHFVPDDNHFPFVFFQCQTGHEAGRFLNSPPNKNQRHIPSMKPPKKKKKNTYMKEGISWEWMRKELRWNKENRAGMRKTGYLGLTRILRERGLGCCLWYWCHCSAQPLLTSIQPFVFTDRPQRVKVCWRRLSSHQG